MEQSEANRWMWMWIGYGLDVDWIGLGYAVYAVLCCAAFVPVENKNPAEFFLASLFLFWLRNETWCEGKPKPFCSSK